MRAPIRSCPRFFLSRERLAGQHAAVNVMPACGQIGEDLTVTPTSQCFRPGRFVQAVVAQVTAARREVAHVGVEHGNRRRGAFDEPPLLRLAFLQGGFRPLLLGDQLCDALQA